MPNIRVKNTFPNSTLRNSVASIRTIKGGSVSSSSTTTEVTDQSNHSGAIGIGFGDTGNGRDYMCQGFIPTLDNITAVSFYVNSKDANTNIGYRVWIDTCDASSNPTNGIGGIGGSTLITNSQINTSGLTKYSLSSVVSLTPGNRYVMVFAPWNTSTNIWASSYHDWVSSTANPYANGRRVHLNGSYANPSAPDSGNDDILFDTYGNQTTTVNSISDFRPTLGLINTIVHTRIRSGGSVSTTGAPGSTFAGKGYLIGMLGLTYIRPQTISQNTVTVVSDFKPNIRIANV